MVFVSSGKSSPVPAVPQQMKSGAFDGLSQDLQSLRGGRCARAKSSWYGGSVCRGGGIEPENNALKGGEDVSTRYKVPTERSESWVTGRGSFRAVSTFLLRHYYSDLIHSCREQVFWAHPVQVRPAVKYYYTVLILLYILL